MEADGKKMALKYLESERILTQKNNSWFLSGQFIFEPSKKGKNETQQEYDEKKEQCKIMYECLKAKCDAGSVKIAHNKREYFTSSNVDLKCMHNKAQFNYYCFNLYPEW